MLASGSRIGAYEVLSPLGAGGMGEVYRARDLKLGREVAIKVLPHLFAADPERLARFAREAQVLASLNHPNIAAIHGLVGDGSESGHDQALVMELVPGDTLAERIAQGPIPLEEALPIARQVVAALEAAHEQGIIHRDLKPANIKVTPDGIVKVLDFGLAKLTGMATTASSTAADAGQRPSTLSMSPTLTSPALMTGVGALLGTAAYMAPEQAKGRVADKRSDVWSVGCVLYEMLTGRRAFEGEDVADTLASVLKGEPDWSRLPADVPDPIRVALRRCLTKDPTRRLAGLSGLSFVLDEAEALTPATASVAPAVVKGRSGSTLAIAAAAAVVAAAIAGWIAWRMRPAVEPQPTRRYELALPEGGLLNLANTRPQMAVSPDARYLAIVVASGQLLLKSPDRPAFAEVSRGVNTANVTFSPDSAWLAFTQGGKLRKLSVNGGAPIDIADVGATPLGMSWSERDTLLYSRGPEGIWSVPAAGGTPTQIIKVDPKSEIAWGPQLLPGGTDVLFTIATTGDANRPGGWDNATVVIETLSTHQRQTLVNGGSDARYLASGHLVYTRQRTLFAIPFDLARKAALAPPAPVLQQVSGGGNGVTFGGQGGASQFSVSSTGTLLYATQPEGSNDRTLTWIDRTGRETPLTTPPRAYTYPRLSPDEKRLALDIRDQKQDIWTWDIRRGVLTPLTFDPAAEIAPVWSPDGTHIAYLRSGQGLFLQAADGSGNAEPMTDSKIESMAPGAFTPDGRVLLVSTQNAAGFDLMAVDVATHKVTPLLADPMINESNPEVSPDGRWLAYQSDEGGAMEIYVRPFPNVKGGTWKVSSNGGTRPRWSADGRELFFMGGGNTNSAGSPLMSVTVTTSPSFQAGPVRQLVAGPFFSGLASRTYDVTRDGQRFIVIKTGAGTATSHVVLIENWFDELRKLAPAK